MLHLLPHQFVGSLMRTMNLESIKNLLLALPYTKEKVANAVEELHEDCTPEDLQLFPNLHTVTGKVTVDSLKCITNTKLRQLNVELLGGGFLDEPPYDDILELLRRSPGLTSLIITRRSTVMLLTLPPQYSEEIETVFSLVDGVISVLGETPEYILDNLDPCHATVRGIQYHSHLEYLMERPFEIIDLTGGASFLLSEDAVSGLKANGKAAASLHSVIVSIPPEYQKEYVIPVLTGRYLFKEQLFDTSYPLIERFDIPVAPEQLPSLLRVFPNVKKVAVVLCDLERVEGLIPNFPDYIVTKDEEKMSQRLLMLREQYPSLDFTVY